MGSHAVTRLKSDVLLMTCRVLITAPDGSTVEARALLDNASSASFISERLVHSLSLPRTNQSIHVSGIGGISHKPPIQSVTRFQLSSLQPSGRKIDITAVVVPKVTCDLPLKPVTFEISWTSQIYPWPILDLVNPAELTYCLALTFSLRYYVRAGGMVLLTSSNDILRKFWEIEESPSDQASLSVEERAVVRHFESNHSRSEEGRFIVPLPKDPNARPIGESRSQAVKRFLSLERSLNQKGCFQEFNTVMQEYLDLKHAEAIPMPDLEKPPELTFYLPMHAVHKASSTTTKIRAVFVASAKSSTGVSLNNTLLVGPTIHPPLVDVLLRFRLYPVALTADVSKMYRARADR